MYKRCAENLNEICPAVFEINSGQIASTDGQTDGPTKRRLCDPHLCDISKEGYVTLYYIYVTFYVQSKLMCHFTLFM